MITQAQVKVLDFLEYTLKIIEDYDEEFKKLSVEEGKEEAKAKQHKELDTVGRFDDVKISYKQLFELQARRGANYVTSTAAYKFADDYIDFQKQYDWTLDSSIKAYAWLNTQVIIPVSEKVKLIIDYTSGKISIVVENGYNSKIVQEIIRLYGVTRLFVTENWLKLDLNEDGKVTLEDFYLLLKSIRSTIENLTIIAKLIKTKNGVYERALKYVSSKEKVKVENPSVKSDESDKSTDSNDMQNSGEKVINVK